MSVPHLPSARSSPPQALDAFVASDAPAGLIPKLFVPRQSIPDAEAIAQNPNLHGVELNRAINRTYVELSKQLQRVLDPEFAEGSKVSPSWYSMAIYASRGAGKGMLAAEAALSVVGGQRSLRDMFPAVPEEDWKRVAPLLEDSRGPAKDCAKFLVAFFLAQQEGPTRLTLDPRVLAISAGRMTSIITRPDTNVFTFTRTLKNMLEDGNRRIFQDIGVSCQHYLELRRDQPGVTPEGVARHFSEDPLAVSAYQDGLRFAASPEDLPTDFAPLYGLNTAPLLASGFALYERASSEKNPELRDRMIQHAGNLLAYHEQAKVAVPAFLPGQILPGETERGDVMEVLTPQVDVKTRQWTWSMHKCDLPDLDGSFWTPPSTERNWAVFEDRWGPILDYFARCAANPESLWPMPNPDPAQGV
ncbi:hypothetical protein ABS71_12200 [bacterium SCN 62-11]|nr:MAG: hypothetical protein ABS71_12200 [bacterium SCN 62-11]